MGLILPRGPSWRYCPTNLSGTPSQASPGTAVTAGANATDGTAVTLLSALSADVELIQIGFMNFNGAGVNGSALADLLIDPAGGTSWASLIDDLLCGETSSVGGNQAIPRWYSFPLFIKAGTSIGVRAKTIHTVDIPGRVVIYAFGGNANPASWWCGQRVTSIGVDATNCVGVAHTPGTSGAFSTWTNFGSTLAARAGAFQFAMQGTGTDVTQNTAGHFWEFGIGADRIGPALMFSSSTGESTWQAPTGPVFYDAPLGAQLQVRAAGNVTPEAIDVAAYAVH